MTDVDMMIVLGFSLTFGLCNAIWLVRHLDSVMEQFVRETVRMRDAMARTHERDIEAMLRAIDPCPTPPVEYTVPVIGPGDEGWIISTRTEDDAT